MNFDTAIPISLYVHTPWCIHKCPYCDFNSHAMQKDFPESDYIERLLNDLDQQLPLLQGRVLHTIFIGGGTPSLFTGESYQKLITGIGQRTPLANNIEITIEANPGTAEQGRFKAYREAGINRLSLGVQSFQDEKLKMLQRIHNADNAKQAVIMAKEADFQNINIDLMFGLPNQSVQDGLDDLQTAIACQSTHLSWYQLTLEPHTPFYHHPPTLPCDEKIETLQEEGQQLLNGHDFQQYEISAYSKPRSQCQHNRNYWQFGDYLGIGAGAHGKITDFSKQSILRRWNHKHPKDYLNREKNVLAGTKNVSLEERPLEFMMNVLRLYEAIPHALFQQRTALELESIQPALKEASSLSLLEWDAHNIQVTEKGHQYLNDLLALF